jgi:hypothetical protein
MRPGNIIDIIRNDLKMNLNDVLMEHDNNGYIHFGQEMR